MYHPGILGTGVSRKRKKQRHVNRRSGASWDLRGASSGRALHLEGQEFCGKLIAEQSSNSTPHQATSQGSWALVILQVAGCGLWPFGVVKGGEGKAFNLKQEGPNQNQLKVHHYYCHKRSSGSWEGHSLAHSSPCLLSLLPVVWLDPHGLVQPIKARRYLGACPSVTSG